MATKAWGPLFAWLVLAGAALSGLVAEHPEPYNRGQPNITPYKDSHRAKLAATHTDNQNGEKGEQKRSWIEGLFDKPTDTLLVIFNGLLVLFTGLLYCATSGLFKETAELRRIADEQRVDLSRSIIAAEKSADAATESNKLSRDLSIAENRPWLSVNITIGPRGLYFDENGANLDLIFIIKNTGKTPAVSANIIGHPSIDIGINERIIALEKICEEERNRRPDARSMGYTVFQDDQITLNFNYSFASKERLEISIENEHGFIMPIIIGCVDYLFSFGEPNHHQSRFIL